MPEPKTPLWFIFYLIVLLILLPKTNVLEKISTRFPPTSATVNEPPNCDLISGNLDIIFSTTSAKTIFSIIDAKQLISESNEGLLVETWNIKDWPISPATVNFVIFLLKIGFNMQHRAFGGGSDF